MKKLRSPDFCADQIDVITNFAVITKVVIKRVHFRWTNCVELEGDYVETVNKFKYLALFV